jgi:acyl-CoA thioesterase
MADTEDGAHGSSWLARLLTLRDGGTDTFVFPEPEAPQGRLFGGMIAAQALAAAAATVDERKLPQSLHAYFVRAGKPDIDVHYRVSRTRDGQSFDTRQVTATQDGSVILELIASFHVPEVSVDWSPPSVPTVDLDAATETVKMAEMSERFEIRVPRLESHGFAGLPYWIRMRHVHGTDAVTRACALTFMSDMGLMGAARPPGVPFAFGRGMAASLDHAIWFHRPFEPTRWHRYEGSGLNFNDARGLAIGSLHTEDGTLVASMTQEALFRL